MYKKIFLSVFLASAMFFFANQFCQAAPITFTSPLKYTTVESFTAGFLERLQGVIVMIAVVFIVIGGLLYMTSAGNEQKIETAKKAISAAVIGLAIAVAAPTFIKEIYIIFGTGVPGSAAGAPSLAKILTNVLNFLLGILGVLAVVMMVFAGIMYLTAAGDETRIETAKKMTKWSIMGVAVALSAIVIVRQVALLFTA